MGVIKTRFDRGENVPAIANIDVVGGKLCKLVAGGAGKQGRVRVTHTNARTDFPFGVIMQDRKAAENCAVYRKPMAYVQLTASGAIAENDEVVPAATAAPTDAAAGNVAALGGAPGANDVVVGRALHAAADGEQVWVATDFKVTLR